MTKYVVKVQVTKYEYYEVEAADKNEALANYSDGTIFDETEDETQAVSATKQG